MPQRLAAPIEVLIEAYSAHPLEKDAAELNAPPDGYVDKAGNFHLKRHNPDDKPVYKAILKPEDGLYMLPYMTRQADGSAWEEDCTQPKAPEDQCRQPFFRMPSRLFEEIDRGIFGVSEQGLANMLSSKADYDFYRAVPLPVTGKACLSRNGRILRRRHPARGCGRGFLCLQTITSLEIDSFPRYRQEF